MKASLAALFPLAYSSACPKDYIKIASSEGSIQFDIVITDTTSSSLTNSGGSFHCSRIWPNERPEIALIPSPPGCLFYGSSQNPEFNNHMPMHLVQDGHLRFIPENELENNDPFQIYDLDCSRILSVTSSKTKRIVIGENCVIPDGCRKARLFKASSSCAIDEVPTEFLESDGWHRNLMASLDSHADVRKPHVAFQWLPRQFFADPDELHRKTAGKAKSVSDSINIENPSLISPPQIVRVDQFPLPVHARVNPPKRGENHFTVNIPKAVWVAPVGSSHCAVEKGNLANLVKLDKEMRLSFMEGFTLVRTQLIKGSRYATTKIPTGNPDDLHLTVGVTAGAAIAGAVAIIISSLSK